MNRLYILLMVMVVMVGAPPFFAAHEALAELLTGTSGNDTLLGTDKDDRLTGRGGEDSFSYSAEHHEQRSCRQVDAARSQLLSYISSTIRPDYVSQLGPISRSASTERAVRTG